MKITIESTTEIVNVQQGKETIPCRLWEGMSAAGTKVFCLIARVAVDKDADARELEIDLDEMKPPSVAGLRVFPARLIL